MTYHWFGPDSTNVIPKSNGVQLASSSLKDTGMGPSIDAQELTAGTMTYSTKALLGTTIHRFDWTNAMIVALGAVGAGDITVCTLPAQTVVTNVYVVINTPDTSANALTVAVGRTAAAYTDYIGASDAKAVGGTVYGAVVGDRGANLTGYDLPSYSATTDVVAHFIKAVTALNTVVACTGSVLIETLLLP